MRKPKLALLGLMTDGYEPIFPGITERQERFAQKLVDTLAPVAEVIFTGAAVNRASIEQKVKEFNAADVDGMLIVLLAYSQGAWIARAMQDNRLPIALCVVQPDQTTGDAFTELDLTVNQGIHGAQDNSNILHRLGLRYQVFAGNWHEERFVRFVQDFGKAAQTAMKLRRMRTAIFGRMQGMGDILTDDFAFFRKLGPESCHDTLGVIARNMADVTDAEIDARIALDKQKADVDPKLTRESHAEAVRMYLAFKRYLQENEFDAVTAHFDIFAADGRFKQLPLYAASQLLAEGYGYAAEGDSVCASMVAAAHTLGDGDANFTEMYAMDFDKQAIIFCHAGEGNWATHREDIRPRLIDRYLGEGGLENPPTFIFTPKVGRATLTSLVSVEGGKMRLLVATGEILAKSDLQNCEMPYFFWKPDSGIESCVEAWLRNGGTHHEVINIGDVSARWRMLCDMLDIEYVQV